MFRIIIFILVVTFCGSLNALAQTRYLTLEPNHSTLGFEVPIAGGATKVVGRFLEADLKITYVDGDWTRSTVEIVIPVASISTGNEDKDPDLQSETFFHAEKHPNIAFVSSSISQTSDSTFVAAGELTMKGVSSMIEFPFEVTYESGNTLGVSIGTSVDRMAFGVGNDWVHTAIPNFIAEQIPLDISFWTRRDKRVE